MPHNYASTRAEAVALSLKAGTDVNCGTYYPIYLPQVLAQGLINETDLETALVRQYSSLIRLGYFDGDAVPYRSLTYTDVDTPHARQLAYQAAVEGINLLKNDGLLPLTIKNGTKIALIGDWANATTQMQGNYAGPAPYLHSPLYAAQQAGANVSYVGVPGGQGDPTTDHWRPVFSAAEEAEIIIFAACINLSVEAEGNDRVSIAWTGPQLDVIGQLAEYGKPMMVLQMGGGQVDSSPIVSNPNISALIWGGIPGQDGGVALLDIIQGKVAPAGRLPLTQYPADYISLIPMTDMTLRPNSTSGSPGRTYQWYTGEPVFEFGHSLHYTNFTASVQSSSPSSYGSSSSFSYDISSLTSNCTEMYKDRCAFKTFSVDIKNTGTVTSEYVMLGFLTGAHGPQPYPNKRLAAYQRLHSITGGSTQTTSLSLTLGSLARVDAEGNTVLYPGDYALLIDNQPLTMVNFTLTGDAVTLDEWPQPPAPVYQTSDYFVRGYGSTYGDKLCINGTM